MSAFGTKALLPFALMAAFGTAAAAQDKKECDINEGSPGEVARAMLALQVAQSSTSPDAAKKQLAAAVAQLEKADPRRNPMGRNFVLGKTLVMWLSQDGVPPVTTRAALGFTKEPQAQIDIVASIDSAFSEIEKAMPNCADETNAWRQQKAWVTLINAAIEQYNADKFDSAETLAKRSLVLYRGGPYGHMVLGNVAQKRNRIAEALQHWRATVDAAKDTIFNDVRRSTLLNMGNTATEAAESATGADKANYLAAAKAAYEELAKDPGQTGGFAEAAQQGLTKLALASGDSGSVKATYQAQLANPGAYTYNQLMSAAVIAANVKARDDALKLFKAAYDKNPYHRDVLANLAIMHIDGEMHGAALPYVKRLLEVDPSNPENYRLYTFAYAGMQKRLMAANREYGKKANATQNQRLKRAYIDSARISNDSIKVVTDLALKYNLTADSLPVKVSFDQFTITDEKTTLGGTIQNNGDASKSYTMKVEFLDKDGKVVATQETNVGPVAGKQSTKFSVTASAKGITAFRYAPLS